MECQVRLSGGLLSLLPVAHVELALLSRLADLGRRNLRVVVGVDAGHASANDAVTEESPH